jgi:DNA-binding NtrC family response regulator
LFVIIGEMPAAYNSEKQKLPVVKNREGLIIGRSFAGYILQRIKKARLFPIPGIIVIAENGTPAEARYLIAKGAFDYIPVPSHIVPQPPFQVIQQDHSEFSIDSTINADFKTEYDYEKIHERLLDGIRHAINSIEIKKRETDLSEGKSQSHETGDNSAKGLKRDNIVGNSPLLKACLEQIARFANLKETVLIIGESGVGKELIAHAIHENSERSKKPFISQNCGAIPESLADSILFGIEKKAASGVDPRVGLFQQAHKGTLFFDEFGELPPLIQPKILTAIETKKIKKVGGNKEIDCNVRLIFATNRNLDEMAREGKFRYDLIYRLGSLIINVPPLRDRLDDIEALSNRFAEKLCSKYDYTQKKLSSEFIEGLKMYDWPGNIRELKSTLEKIIIEAPHETILSSYYLPDDIRLKWIIEQFTGGGRDDDIENQFNILQRTINFIDDPTLKNIENPGTATYANIIDNNLNLSNDQLLSFLNCFKAISIKAGMNFPDNFEDKLSSSQDEAESSLPTELGIISIDAIKNKVTLDFSSIDRIPKWKPLKEKIQKIYTEQLMKHTKNNIADASKIYDVSISQFYKVLDKCNIPTK